MSDITTTFLSDVLSAIAGKSTLSVSGMHIGLFLTPGNDFYPGREPSDSAYTRQPVALSSPREVVGELGCMRVYNSQDIVFPAATISWGQLLYYGIFSDNGQMLFTGTLNAPITVKRWDTAIIPSGFLVIQMG